MKTFVITGCGRSGTSYSALLLTHAGVRCGHERSFTGSIRRPPVYTPQTVDSSWFALPHIDRDDIFAIHLIRDPLRVISSWKANKSLHSRFVRRFLSAHMPEILEPENDEFTSLLKYWVLWNELAETTCDIRTKIESPDFPDDLVEGVITTGRNMDYAELSNAFSTAPRTVNHKNPVKPVRWGDLPDSYWKDQAMQMAERFGYPL
jgi:hypothetical protein